MEPKIGTDSSIWGALARSHDKSVIDTDDTNAVGSPDKKDPAREETASTRVVLSEDALERAARDKKAIAELSKLPAQSGKDAARAKIAEIKQRIKMLKMMLAMAGASAARAIISELRQLMGQLAAAAATLQSGGGGGGGTSVTAQTAPVVHGASAAQGTMTPAMSGMAATVSSGPALASAETVMSASATSAAATASEAVPSASDSGNDDAPEGAADPASDNSAQSRAQERDREARQRQADARSVNEVMRELKALLAAAEQIRRKDESEDKDDGDSGGEATAPSIGS